jgi:hypothetical protein
MLTISAAAIGVLIVIALFLVGIAKGWRRRRHPASFELNSLGAVSPRWLIEHRHSS